MLTFTDYITSHFPPPSLCDPSRSFKLNIFPPLNILMTSNRHICDELYDLFSITLLDIRPEDIAV